MGSIRRKQRWPTTAIALTLIVACFALNVLLYGAKLPVKVHGFVRHPRALRHADRWATGFVAVRLNAGRWLQKHLEGC